MQNRWDILKTMKKISLIFFITIFLIGIYLLFRGIVYQANFDIPTNAIGNHIIINDMKIRYYQVGHGKDIVFLHGAMGSVEDFIPLYDKLKNRYRMTSFDRPGYGYSEIKNSAYNFDANIDLVQQLIKKLNIKNPVLFGHSHGGAIALNLATKNPEAIKGYILLAPAAYYYERFEKIVNSVPMKLLRLPGINTGIALTVGPIIGDKMIEDTLLRMIVDKSKFPENFISFRQELWNKPISTITRANQLNVFHEDIINSSENYGSINSPTLVLFGEKDSFEVKDSADKLSKNIKGTKIKIIHNSGHYSQFDATNDVILAIDDFMSKI